MKKNTNSSTSFIGIRHLKSRLRSENRQVCARSLGYSQMKDAKALGFLVEQASTRLDRSRSKNNIHFLYTFTLFHSFLLLQLSQQSQDLSPQLTQPNILLNSQPPTLNLHFPPLLPPAT
jgi:hypothetical protein